MIRSMTGFARGTLAGSKETWNIEIRSVNHKYLDILVKGDPILYPYETPIKTLVRDIFKRGHVEIAVNRECSNKNKTVTINTALAKEYFKKLEKIRRELKLLDAPALDLIARLPDVIHLGIDKQTLLDAHEWTRIKIAINKVLALVKKARQREGAKLFHEIYSHLALLIKVIKKIEDFIPEHVRLQKEKLVSRFNELMSDKKSDEFFISEVSRIVEKTDITEELSRFKSHLKEVGFLLQNKDAVGRQLDFMCQELNREANTMGAKINNALFTKPIVLIKETIEKIREQVQNIE